VLRIRLRRTGAKKQPRYRFVVAESRAPRDGAFVEVLGWYNPQTDPAQVVVNTEKAAAWIAKGAQPSERVAYLLKQAELKQAQQEAAPEAAAPTPARRSSRAAAASDAGSAPVAATVAGDTPTAESDASAAGASGDGEVDSTTDASK
jgi:small subunit ribosomal protein S16